ncbi:HAD-IIA family hydrolase [Thiorhodovibrio frisius]|uniref:Putative sugar phosphatase of HAD superfamily n=1 Tax=Thiorhodovibrio frisius TaxID=631362 RepID=H8Z508_9GAMM|nr:HAD hydrolase-like protein [Thiorhodovibrio frisius]EIC20415.1 putative sugar phosphatase of HAD superfamily [Thiorhodovibrio frisius]WPL21156.1 putative hydrolase YutF [Thiorhodovibrio frisius]
MPPSHSDPEARLTAPLITPSQLIERYDGFLLDAYGVLLDDTGPLPGAADFLARLDAAGKPWLIVTNAASRLPQQLAADFTAKGLALDAQHLLTSGMLLQPYFARHGLQGASCLLLGPPSAQGYVTRAGGRLIEDDQDAEVVVIADQNGVRWPEDFNRALNLIMRRQAGGESIHLLLCNPDLIFPCAPGAFSLTAGAMAVMLETVLNAHHPDQPIAFERLGKPCRPIFDQARQQLGVQRPVMIGDQLGTDIRGGLDAGLDAVLVGTGLAGGAPVIPAAGGTKAADLPQPTWQVRSLVDNQMRV